MELQAKDLRIGNLFLRPNGTTGKISYHEIQLMVVSLEKPNYKPIPITEDWHNNFGVKPNNFENFEYDIGNNKVIVFNGDYIFLRQRDIDRHEDDIVAIWNNDLKRRDIYVHEWQNLYFALTNKELKLK